MTSVDIRFIVDVVLTISGSILCLAYCLTDQRRKAKKPIYAFTAIILMSAALIYGYALLGPDVYFIRSGWATNIIILLLVSAVIINIIMDWRKNVR